MAETQIYYGSDLGTVLGPYPREGIQEHIRARQTLTQHHGAGDIYRIDATSMEDARAKLTSRLETQRQRAKRTRAAR